MDESQIVGWICGGALFVLALVYMAVRHYFLVKRNLGVKNPALPGGK